MRTDRINIKVIMIALVLIGALLGGVFAVDLIEDSVGMPVFYEGEMQNICVRVTEVCSSNRSILMTEDVQYPDYIELYNYGESFDLSELGLTTDAENKVEYEFEEGVFEAGSYIVVFLDGVDVPFRLSKQGGEYLAVVSGDGVVIDSLTTLAMEGDEVMLREEEGFVVSREASPGYPNTEEGVAAFLDSSEGRMPLVINEVFTANSHTLPDSFGAFSDVIELKNLASEEVSTAGYCLSDSAKDRAQYPLPEVTLFPGETLLVFASGADTVTEDGQIHANFRLSEGEELILATSGRYNYLKMEKCETGYSFSRNSEGGYEIMAATPGFENSEAGYEEFADSRINKDSPIIISELLFAQDQTPYGGALRDVIEIYNRSDKPVSTRGYYISDEEDEPYKFPLPVMTLEAGQCTVLYAEDGEGDNLCGFALSTGESLYLTCPDYRRTEFVSCAPAGRGLSRNYLEDKGEAVYVSAPVSIGYPNTQAGQQAYISAIRPNTVEISEIVSSNNMLFPGPYATYHDFIELHNRGDKEVTLTGWYLSDDPKEPRKGSLDGVVIPGGGYVVIILSSDGINLPDGYHTVPFAINASGEELTLSKGDEIIDSVSVPSLARNTSYGRAYGADGFSILYETTPNHPNSAGRSAPTPEPLASKAQGVYGEGLTLELSGEGEIYYTLDCTVPTADSIRYTEPLRITSTTVVRCMALAEGKEPSNVCDLTYIINEGDTLEAVSLVTDPDNLFNYYTGIYEEGPNASPNHPHFGANYHLNTEKPASVAFFPVEGEGFYENCGVRMFGGYSRAQPKKSFALFFRNVYGASSLDYQVFEDDPLASFEAIVLRNTGQDFYRSSMRDAMITDMAGDYLGLDVQKNRPVVLYLNGEFWGIYFIREKVSENYVAGHYNVDPDETIIAGGSGWSSGTFRQILTYSQQNDMSQPEHYEYICSQIDVDNYVDYIAAQMIIGNTDLGNVKMLYCNGKWRWIMYDVDQSFSGSGVNVIYKYLYLFGPDTGDITVNLVNMLVKNDQFRASLLKEFAYQLENVWTPENVNRYIDDYLAKILPDMHRECERWMKDYGSWERSVQSLRNFIADREHFIIQQLKEQFILSDEEMRGYGFNI